jgi:hypothetical protein
MLGKLRSRRPSHATVVAYLALFVALGGTAIATHETILSSDIVDGEVKTPDLATNAVTNPKLGANAVGTGKVLDNNLQGADLLNGTVATADLANRAVTPTKVGTIPAGRVTKVSNQTVPRQGNRQLAFDFEEFDTAGLFNPANNSRLRAPISGVYDVSAEVHWASTQATGYRRLCVLVNTTFCSAQGTEHGHPEYSPIQNVSDLLKLSAGDYVEVSVDQGSAGDVLVNGGLLAMTWVGPG